MPRSDPEKVEALDKLAKAARHRFDTRREHEWKIFFGVWTGFGGAAGFVLGANEWEPGWPEAVGSAAAGAITCACVWLYAGWKHRCDASDTQMSYYWESAIEHLAGYELPQHLQPTSKGPGKGGDKWYRHGQHGSPPPAFTFNNWHVVPSSQVVVTILFAVTFAGHQPSRPGRRQVGEDDR